MNVCAGCGQLGAKTFVLYGEKKVPYCTRDCAEGHHTMKLGQVLGAKDERWKVEHYIRNHLSLTSSELLRDISAGTSHHHMQRPSNDYEVRGASQPSLILSG